MEWSSNIGWVICRDWPARPGGGARSAEASTSHRKTNARGSQAKLSVEVQIQISNVQRMS
jgi:hypothetical protein